MRDNAPLPTVTCACLFLCFRRASGQDRISDFELKLMDIDSEHLGIPKTEYNCMITVRGDMVTSFRLQYSLCNVSFRSDHDPLVCVFRPYSS